MVRSSHQFRIIKTLYVFLIMIIMASPGCFLEHPSKELSEPQTPAPSPVSEGACIDINGKVFGDILPNSTVALYRTPSIDYEAVMEAIATKNPLKNTTVNESKGFAMKCIYPGTYALVIPKSSYEGAVGSPLPYEFDCENLSLRIAFQGGDYRYAVGAFSLATAPFYGKAFGQSQEHGSLHQ